MSDSNKNIFPINFIDLKAQQQPIRANIEQALLGVLDHGCYIGGPEVAQLEHELQKFCGVKHAITCANGTDALSLALLAKGIKTGDAVFVPSYTFAASVEVIAYCGATPIFVDVDKHSFNIDVASLEQAILKAKEHNLQPKAIVAVDIFGLPADYNAINILAQKYCLWVLADSAQSFGAEYHNQKVGTLGLITTTSFFPAKPFGCYGDGGCIFTDNDELNEAMRSYKSHGQGDSRNHFIRVGVNSRLDSFQAAVLLEKLKIFPAELTHRQAVADAYREMLSSSIRCPVVPSTSTSSWAQYTIVLPENINRNELAMQLKDKSIPTAVYYDIPTHKQPAYSEFTKFSPSLENTDYLSQHVISLPMDGYLSMEKIKYISDNVNLLVDK